jgi:hypothetical protein
LAGCNATESNRNRYDSKASLDFGVFLPNPAKTIKITKKCKHYSKSQKVHKIIENNKNATNQDKMRLAGNFARLAGLLARLAGFWARLAGFWAQLAGFWGQLAVFWARLAGFWACLAGFFVWAEICVKMPKISKIA